MNFSEIEIQSFLSKKVDGNRKSTDYWKVLVSKFSEIGNTVFLSQKVDGKVVIFTDYWKVLVLNFSEIGNTVGFFEPKSRENLVFLSFLWYSRAWEIWFFVQWDRGMLDFSNYSALSKYTKLMLKILYIVNENLVFHKREVYWPSFIIGLSAKLYGRVISKLPSY